MAAEWIAVLVALAAFSGFLAAQFAKSIRSIPTRQREVEIIIDRNRGVSLARLEDLKDDMMIDLSLTEDSTDENELVLRTRLEAILDPLRTCRRARGWIRVMCVILYIGLGAGVVSIVSSFLKAIVILFDSSRAEWDNLFDVSLVGSVLALAIWLVDLALHRSLQASRQRARHLSA